MCQSLVVKNPSPIQEENQEEEIDLAGQLVSFAPIGAGIALAMLVVIGLLSIVGRKIGSKSETDEEKYTRRGATKEIETGSVEQFGGIIEDEKWDDDVASLLDLNETPSEDDSMDDVEDSNQGKQRDSIDDSDLSSSESDEESSEVSEESGNWESAQEGWQVYQTSEQDGSDTPAEQPPVEAAAPAEAPPLPEGGLPEGWTMDQWRWYGHEWLEKNGGN